MIIDNTTDTGYSRKKFNILFKKLSISSENLRTIREKIAKKETKKQKAFKTIISFTKFELILPSIIIILIE